MTKKNTALRLTESAMMVAFATVLSFIKLADLPAGGSITLASALPILIIAYRYGTPWGLLCGFVHGAIQLAIGAGTLSYVTGAASVIAVILLDYILAFAAIGVGGIFRRVFASQSAAMAAGGAAVSVLRYICHVISGATVWAGLSIPDTAALRFSLIYNATYMLPEMLILVTVAIYVSRSLDFTSPRLAPAKRSGKSKAGALSYIPGALIAAALVFDIAAVFSKLQDPSSGEFDVTAIATVNWVAVIAVSATAVVIAGVIMLCLRRPSGGSPRANF